MNRVEKVLCQFLGSGHQKLAAPTSCLLGRLLLEPSHHAERKPKQPMGRKGPRGEGLTLKAHSPGQAPGQP
jgi:hypothetical protein